MKLIVNNKKAYFNYTVVDEYEVGIVLFGTEIKSIRKGKVSITEAYCSVINNELKILNMTIKQYEYGNIFNHEEGRIKKLLAHKSEIRKLSNSIKGGLTIIPLKLYIKEGKAKILIGTCKGKKNYDKREVIKERDLKRVKVD